MAVKQRAVGAQEKEERRTAILAAAEKLYLRHPVGFDDVFKVTRDHFIRVPGYLALTSRCFAMMDREIPLDVAIAFKKRIGLLLAGAGAGLARHFPLTLPQGVTILMHSYGLIVGLWQLVHPNERLGKAMNQPALRALKLDYEREIEAALRALWSGTLAAVKAATPKSRKTR